VIDKLDLVALPPVLHYTGKPVEASMRFLQPDAAKSILGLEAATGGVVYTDVWRPAFVSLAARQAKTGVQPPGWSAHSYGYSIDFAIDQTLQKLNWDYANLLKIFAAHGWYCHRRDEKRGWEDWHFNYIGMRLDVLTLVAPAKPSTWDDAVERLISEKYDFTLTPVQVVEELITLNYSSVEELQSKWGLGVDGVAGPKTQRLIAYLAAEHRTMTALRGESPVPAPSSKKGRRRG
jgi:hypothetical protein